jgi:uncharacterized Rmd1/YagE family protein
LFNVAAKKLGSSLNESWRAAARTMPLSRSTSMAISGRRSAAMPDAPGAFIRLAAGDAALFASAIRVHLHPFSNEFGWNDHTGLAPLPARQAGNSRNRPDAPVLTTSRPGVPQCQPQEGAAVSNSVRRITARALLLGDRIDTQGLERDDVLAAMPLTFRVGAEGIVSLFRFGVAVLFGMSPIEEDEVIRKLEGRIRGKSAVRDQESAQIEIGVGEDEQIAPNGTITLKKLTTEHALLIADALATTVILAHDERSVAAVFDSIEPLARELALQGRTPGGRRSILKHIGNALLVQQRVSGLVAVEEKPDILWERPDLERFYARLEDWYELKERADVLTRKLRVISETANALADIINTQRSLRLEQIIVALILVEILITAFQIWRGG